MVMPIRQSLNSLSYKLHTGQSLPPCEEPIGFLHQVHDFPFVTLNNMIRFNQFFQSVDIFVSLTLWLEIYSLSLSTFKF